MIASQSETKHVKRDICRGRLWLRSLTQQPLPDYAGLDLSASAKDRLAGVTDVALERLFRLHGDSRYPD